MIDLASEIFLGSVSVPGTGCFEEKMKSAQNVMIGKNRVEEAYGWKSEWA